MSSRSEAMPARNSQPGVTPSPLPANSGGMSVATSVPLPCLVSTRVPPCQLAVAGASS